MCSSQGSKFFFPPTPMGAGDFSIPMAYQSNQQQTLDAGNQKNPALQPVAPPNVQPPSAPKSNVMRPGGGFGGFGGFSGFSGNGFGRGGFNFRRAFLQ